MELKRIEDLRGAELAGYGLVDATNARRGLDEKKGHAIFSESGDDLCPEHGVE